MTPCFNNKYVTFDIFDYSVFDALMFPSKWTTLKNQNTVHANICVVQPED